MLSKYKYVLDSSESEGEIAPQATLKTFKISKNELASYFQDLVKDSDESDQERPQEQEKLSNTSNAFTDEQWQQVKEVQEIVKQAQDEVEEVESVKTEEHAPQMLQNYELYQIQCDGVQPLYEDKLGLKKQPEIEQNFEEFKLERHLENMEKVIEHDDRQQFSDEIIALVKGEQFQISQFDLPQNQKYPKIWKLVKNLALGKDKNNQQPVIKSQTQCPDIQFISNTEWADHMVQAYLNGNVQEVMLNYTKNLYGPYHPITIDCQLKANVEINYSDKITKDWEIYADFFGFEQRSFQFFNRISDLIDKTSLQAYICCSALSGNLKFDFLDLAERCTLLEDLELNYLLTLIVKLTDKSLEWLTLLALYRQINNKNDDEIDFLKKYKDSLPGTQIRYLIDILSSQKPANVATEIISGFKGFMQGLISKDGLLNFQKQQQDEVLQLNVNEEQKNQKKEENKQSSPIQNTNELQDYFKSDEKNEVQTPTFEEKIWEPIDHSQNEEKQSIPRVNKPEAFDTITPKKMTGPKPPPRPQFKQQIIRPQVIQPKVVPQKPPSQSVEQVLEQQNPFTVVTPPPPTKNVQRQRQPPQARYASLL